MSARGGLEHDLVGFVTDALALDHEVEEDLGATTGCPDERSKRSYNDHRAFPVGLCECSVSDSLEDVPHDGHDYVYIHGHLKHASDTVRIHHVATPVGLRFEEPRWLVR